MMELVSIIIPHYNGVDILSECLTSLRLVSYKNIEIIVVDNGSTDQSVQHIKRHFPHVRVIENKSNFGFSKACNVGIHHSKGPFILIINNDTYVKEDFLEPLIKEMEDPQVCAVQGKILNYYQRNLFDHAGAAGCFVDPYGFTLYRGYIINSAEIDRGQYDDRREIFWASGCCMLLRKQHLQSTGVYFDEDFFLYGEDIDLCWRLRASGKKIVFTPSSIIYHKLSATARKTKLKSVYLLRRNHVLILIKNYSLKTLWRILPIKFLLDILSLFYLASQKEFKKSLAVLAAWSWLLLHPFYLVMMHRHTQRKRIVSDHEVMKLMTRLPIPVLYFLFKKKFFWQFCLPESPLVTHPSLDDPSCDFCGRNDRRVLLPSTFHKTHFSKNPAEHYGYASSNTGRGAIVQCVYCNLIYQSPRDRYVEEIYKDVGTDNYYLLSKDERQLTCFRDLRKMEKIVGPSNKRRLLDVGCSYGLFMEAASHSGWNVSGIELSKTQSKVAQKKYAHVYDKPIEQCQFSDGFFDVITGFDVIEHLSSPSKFLREAQRILKPGGFLVMCTPNIESYPARLMGRLWINYLRMHFYYFSHRTIASFLERENFKILKIERHKRIIKPSDARFWVKDHRLLFTLMNILFNNTLTKNIKMTTGLSGNIVVYAQKNQ